MSKAREIVFKSSNRSNTHKDLLPAFSNEEINTILTKIQDSGEISTIMNVKEPFNQIFLPDQMINENTPQVCVTVAVKEIDRLSLMNKFSMDNIDKTIVELRQMASSINIIYTPYDIEYIEKTTLSKTKSLSWFKLRAGLITASNFKLVCTTTVERPELSTIIKICYPKKFTSRQTQYGLRNESVARQAYIE